MSSIKIVRGSNVPAIRGVLHPNWDRVRRLRKGEGIRAWGTSPISTASNAITRVNNGELPSYIRAGRVRVRGSSEVMIYRP